MSNTKKRWAFIASWAVFVMSVTLSCGVETGDALPTLDIEAAIDNPREFDLAEIAESIEFIPLDDSRKEGLIGLMIGQMGESRDGFYLCEGFMTPVQHFDRTGKFVSTIGRIGRGPNETNYIFGMAVDYETGNVYINGSVGYDSSGRMFARNDSVSGSRTVYHNGQLLLLTSPSILNPDAYNGERIDFIKILSRDLKHEGTIDVPNFGPADYFFTDSRSGALGTGSVAFMSDGGERIVVRQGRNDTIYHYATGVLEPALVLNIGRYSLPAEGYGLNPAVEWSDKFYSVDNLWEGSRYVVVSADNYQLRPTGERIPGRRLIFDREDLSAGGFSATGPDGTPGLFLDGIKFTPMYVRNNRLVGYMQALDIVDNAENITDQQLKALAATLKEDSNPVIAVVELKK